MNASLYREGACVSLSFQSELGSWSGRTHVLCVCVILSLSFVLFLLVCVCVELPSEENKANRSSYNTR